MVSKADNQPNSKDNKDMDTTGTRIIDNQQPSTDSNHSVSNTSQHSGGTVPLTASIGGTINHNSNNNSQLLIQQQQQQYQSTATNRPSSIPPIQTSPKQPPPPPPPLASSSSPLLLPSTISPSKSHQHQQQQQQQQPPSTTLSQSPSISVVPMSQQSVITTITTTVAAVTTATLTTPSLTASTQQQQQQQHQQQQQQQQQHHQQQSLIPPVRYPHSSFSLNKNEEFEFEVPAEAPVFVPTIEEFKNPLTYISKIRPVAEKYGICKIKPPSTWQPPFTVDVDKLRFTPRVQRLNELEAKTRVKLNFLDQIAKFWELQGSSLKIPMVERKALDLYSLHRIVQTEGGLEQVTKDRKWSKVACRLGYPAGKSVGTILKGHYERILFPFDLFTSGKTEDCIKKLEKSEQDDHDYKPHGILSRQKLEPPTVAVARRSQRNANNNQNHVTSSTDFGCSDSIDDKKQCYDDDGKNVELRRLQFYGPGPKMAGFKGGRNDSKARMNCKKGYSGASQTVPLPVRRNIDPLAKYICHICNRGDVEEAMLLCDGCDDSYHTFCLMPPLENIPKGDWRCPKCVVEEVSKPTEAFGFEQAQREYTLQQFGEMADQFKADYFNIPVHLVPTELVEREFWRIVSSIDEDVAVEYGADLHTMDHGSGFPTKSSLYLLPGDQEYAESSWNLNNLPLLEESILGYINADISGMKVPWMYVGMCFATFCWHNEDHWSYSINYLHWGEPKTWYGVPGNKAEAFENTMKRAAPELFQSQPDLLHQLVTIMNPNILMNSGVPVYRTDQHAGEFIITFPRAYHAGFNQGYNFAEAVNFAPADWMKMGRECINHYSTLRRFCVFSHDELVCKMALEPDRLNLGIATACYLDMAEMVDCEKKLRKSLLEWGVTKAEREAFELLPDDERQCDVCKTTCFLSAVTCTCIKAIVCLRHYSELCKCPPDRHTLKYRYTLDELPLMLRKLKVKAESFENWLSKVRDVIDPNTPTTINLDELQELAQEAEDKKFPGSVLLERLNSAVLEAEKCVTVIQQLDINKMRTRTRNSCEFAKYKLTLEELDLFVQEINNLCCVIPEGNSVRELQKMGKEFVEMANFILNEPLNMVEQSTIEKLIEEGSSLCIELPQIKALKYVNEQVQWYSSVREVRDSGEKIPVTTIKRLLNDGMNIVPDNILEKELCELQSIMVAVDDWEIEAKKCFESGTQHEIPEIEELLRQAELIEGNLPMQPMLKDALKKAKEWLSTVEILQTNENYPYFHTLENVVNRGKNIPFQLEELKRMEEHLTSARLWKQRTSRTFLKKNSQFTLMEALSPRAEPLMLPNRNRLAGLISDEQLTQQFTEEMSPIQMVVSFKNAEEKEMQEMREFRRQNASKSPEIDKYCICRRRFYGTMYHCELCKDWFHSSCVSAPRNTVRPRPTNTNSPSVNSLLVPPLNHRERDRQIKYLCPSCMRSRRPRLETILSLLVSLQRLPIRLPEGEALQCLTERAMNWQDRARQALATDDVVAALATLSAISQKNSTENMSIGAGSGTVAAATAAATARESNNGNNRTKRTMSRTSDSSETESDIEEMGILNNINLNADDNVIEMDNPLSQSNVVEHAYSVPSPSVASSLYNYGKTGNLTKTDIGSPPLITLKKSTRESLDDLMMEGDLLEVSLDETLHLWRILNATKCNTSDLAYIHCKYKIMPHPNENLVSNIRKRCADEQYPSSTSKRQNKQNRSGGSSSTTGSTAPTGAAPLSSSSLSSSTTTSSGTFQPGSISSLSSTLGLTHMLPNSVITVSSTISTNTSTSGSAGAPATASSSTSTINSANPKMKRGRKMKILTKDVGVTSLENTKKKKRGRKSALENRPKMFTGNSGSVSGVSNTNTAGSGSGNAGGGTTSDEDEDCSATHCVRPTGREVDWVQCDGGCNEWFHMLCVGLVKNQVKPDDDFVCKKCKKHLPTIDNNSDNNSTGDPIVPLKYNENHTNLSENFDGKTDRIEANDELSNSKEKNTSVTITTSISSTSIATSAQHPPSSSSSSLTFASVAANTTTE